jgi:quercetin dioxygenase-like cupin family protein
MSSELERQILLRSEQSAGVVSVIASTMPGRTSGPRLHRHDFDEAFYVLDGELTVQLGDELYRFGPGQLAFAPRGVVHTLANLSPDSTEFLIICTPAGFERNFARRRAERAGVQPPEWALQPGPVVTYVGDAIPIPQTEA